MVFASPTVRIATFRCAVDHPLFKNSGPLENYCFVFPRSAFWLFPEQGQPFVVNPNVVTFFNRGQEFQRRAICSDGDRCEWFAIQEKALREIVREFDPQAEGRPERPFALPRSCSTPEIYFAQRELFNRVASSAFVAPLWVEEQVILLLHRVLQSTYGGTPPCPMRRNALHFVEEVLSDRWDQPLRLSDLAAAAAMSEYYLCRTFRKLTGVSLHQYQVRLRLRQSLELVCESRQSLTDIALSTGFSSHSHFTSAFRQEFGCPPSKLRNN